MTCNNNSFEGYTSFLPQKTTSGFGSAEKNVGYHSEMYQSHSRNSILFLSLQYFHNIAKSDIDIDLSVWKNETNKHKGFKNTIFDRYDRVIVPLSVGDEQYYLLEIKNRKQANTSIFNYHMNSQKFLLPEIILYDSNIREFKHLHNTLFLIARRFIFEELLDKSTLSQAQCYQDSLTYTFKRADCPQEPYLINSKYVGGGNVNNESSLYFIKNCVELKNDGNLNMNSYDEGPIKKLRIMAFALCEKSSQIGISNNLPPGLLG